MGQHRDLKTDREEYQFIKETIKERPKNDRSRVSRIASLFLGGALFGVGAAGAFSWAAPVFTEYFEEERGREDVRLVTPTPAGPRLQEMAATQDTAADPEEGVLLGEAADPLASYEEIYSRILEVAQEPRKALVTICGMSGDASLLDSSQLVRGSSEGIVFLKNGSFFYILTEFEEIEAAEKLQVTFCDGTVAEGLLCQGDPFTGLAVVEVPFTHLQKGTKERVFAARLSDADRIQQATPVIAIGSPTGDVDGVQYGVVTALSREVMVPDATYHMLTTDMHGSAKSSGFLLDKEGAVVGLITQKGSEDNCLIRALPISQVRNLVEVLSNGRPIRYLGIYGRGVSSSRAEVSNVPTGVYVSKVDKASPAMDAGILSGDIITGLGEKSIKTMASYTYYLQRLEVGQRVKVTVARDGGSGRYEKMELEVTIQER